MPWVAAGGVGLLFAGFGLAGAWLLMGREEHEEPPKKTVFDGIELGGDGLDSELRVLVQKEES